MRFFILLFCLPLFTLSCFSKSVQGGAILVVDSSFAPTQADCYWITELPQKIPQKGSCYDKQLWKKFEPYAEQLKGLMDYSAGKRDSVFAKKWMRFQKSNPQLAQDMRGQYILAVHGSRSAEVIKKYSQQKQDLVFVRNLSSQAGANVSQKVDSKVLNFDAYKNGCGLVDWKPSTVKAFRKGLLQEHQQRLSSLITSKKAKIVNLSLGYKKSWIAEDNPRCTPSQVEKEYLILKQTWKSLLKKHPQTLFVVAAGNENEDFDNPKYKDNDLWSAIAPQKNLVVVGSMKLNGSKFPSSNYGELVNVFAKGEEIKVSSPLPTSASGYSTTIRGTSFSAPLFSARAADLLKEQKNIDSLVVSLANEYREERLERINSSLKTECMKKTQECMLLILSLIRSDVLWSNTTDFYREGKADWKYAPLPIEYDETLEVNAQTTLVQLGSDVVPGLKFKFSDDIYDLYLSLHHELYHYSTMDEAAKFITSNTKIDSCMTQYQIELLKDETPAFKKEIEFYKSSPRWFKEELDKKMVHSKLLGKKLKHSEFYQNLEEEMTKDPKFIIKRYVALGQYPECALNLDYGI